MIKKMEIDFIKLIDDFNCCAEKTHLLEHDLNQQEMIRIMEDITDKIRIIEELVNEFTSSSSSSISYVFE